MNDSTRVLGNFQPSQLTKESIGEELLKFVCEELAVTPAIFYLGHGPKYYQCVEIRDARVDERARLQEDIPEIGAITHFHRDMHFSGKLGYFIVWSNTAPTKVQFSDGSLLEAKPGDVILVDNKTCQHRAPDGEGLDRYFARLLVNPC